MNLIGICLEGNRIIPSGTIKVRFSYLHVLHSHVRVCGGHGDASYTEEPYQTGLHTHCGRILLLSSVHDPSIVGALKVFRISTIRSGTWFPFVGLSNPQG